MITSCSAPYSNDVFQYTLAPSHLQVSRVYHAALLWHRLFDPSYSRLGEAPTLIGLFVI